MMLAVCSKEALGQVHSGAARALGVALANAASAPYTSSGALRGLAGLNIICQSSYFVVLDLVLYDIRRDAVFFS